jgi:hypothetical protein
MFSINKITEVEQTNISLDNMKLNEINLEDMIKIGKEMEKTKNS